MNLVNDYIVEPEIIGGEIYDDMSPVIIAEGVVNAKELFKYAEEQREKDKISK